MEALPPFFMMMPYYRAIREMSLDSSLWIEAPEEGASPYAMCAQSGAMASGRTLNLNNTPFMPERASAAANKLICLRGPHSSSWPLQPPLVNSPLVKMVDPDGFEPPTSCLQSRHSTN